MQFYNLYCKLNIENVHNSFLRMGGNIVEEKDLNIEPGALPELEEDVIPTEDVQDNEDRLGDVVPCEYVAIEQDEGEAFDMSGNSDDGFYDDVGYITPTVSTDQMVDIVSQVEENESNSLEEEVIPNEYNTADDEQLDDVA